MNRACDYCNKICDENNMIIVMESEIIKKIFIENITYDSKLYLCSEQCKQKYSELQL